MLSGVVECRFTRDCFSEDCPQSYETLIGLAFYGQIVQCCFVAVQHAIQLYWIGLALLIAGKKISNDKHTNRKLGPSV